MENIVIPSNIVDVPTDNNLGYLRSDTPYMEINWEPPFLSYPGLVRIQTPTDGSCFFHAILKAFYKPYIEGRENGKLVDRNKLISQLRKELADKLAQPADITVPEGPTNYDLLSRGSLSELSKSMTNDYNYTLEGMQDLLLNGNYIDEAYYEYISNRINKDIYIISSVIKDVIPTGDTDLYYKGRDSIVLLYIPGHYELIGLKSDNGTITTHFTSTHPFITELLTRYRRGIHI